VRHKQTKTQQSPHYANVLLMSTCAFRCRYRKLLLGVDLTKNFFFSYSYSLAHTLQHNHKQAAAGTNPSPAAATAAAAAAAAGGGATAPEGPSSSVSDAAAHNAAAAAAAAAGWDVYDSSMFVWNAYLTRPLRAAIQSGRWTVPLVHGYWEQRQVRCCTFLSVLLHFA
jgi:hypothetical protein